MRADDERNQFGAALQEILDMASPLGREGDPLARAQMIAAKAIGDANEARNANSGGWVDHSLSAMVADLERLVSYWRRRAASAEEALAVLQAQP